MSSEESEVNPEQIHKLIEEFNEKYSPVLDIDKRLLAITNEALALQLETDQLQMKRMEAIKGMNHAASKIFTMIAQQTGMPLVTSRFSLRQDSYDHIDVDRVAGILKDLQKLGK